MAIKIPGMKFLSGADAKSRVFILFAGVAALSLIVFFVIRFFSGGPQVTAGSKVATAPSSLQTVPGGQMSPEFYRAVVQANAQAAKQAQISGGSSVPTLINVPGQQAGFPEQNCTVLCPSDDNVNVADDINSLIKDGKLTQEEGNRLLELAKNNVPVDEYAAALNELVRQGKLTPEQARQLLEKYRKQHDRALQIESGGVMDAMIKSGQLPLDVANQLLALQKSGISPSDYAAELDRLVKEGKISPETAARLLAQYTQQQMREQAKKGAFNLQQMTKAGQLTPDVAQGLLALQAKNVPADQYTAEVNRLVAAGKMTPAVAAKLLDDYKKQRAGLGATPTGVSPEDVLQQMLASGEISPEVAQELKALQGKNLTVDQYADELKRLVAAGKLSPEAAAKLLAAYKQQHSAAASEAAINMQQMVKSGQIAPDVAQALLAFQSKNPTVDEYEAELKRLVAAGKLTPEAAAKLLENYKRQHARQGIAGTLTTLLTSSNPSTRAAAQRLATMQGNNASIADYVKELKKAVQAGDISPEVAGKLLEEYRAMAATVPTPGVAPGIDTNVPGGAEFAKLAENLQAPAATAAAPPETFEAPVQVPPPPPPVAVLSPEAEQARLQRIAQLQAAMSGQATLLTQAWQPPVMVHKEGAPPEKSKEGTTTTTTTTGGAGASGKGGIAKKPLIKAGTILFAVLDTAVDSDYPDTPVMATIVQGDMKGAKLLGKLSLAQGQDKVSLIFNLMDKDDWMSAKSINAFAIDPDTARTVMASNVNYHYLKRYGAMMGSAFVSGYANAITQAGSTTTTGIFGTSTVHPQLSPTQKIAVGMGQVGTTMGNQIASYINTPTTVKVNSGVGLGILFMAELPDT